MGEEIWKIIPGFEDYEISNFGKVKSKEKSWEINGHTHTRSVRFLKPHNNGDNYFTITLTHNGSSKKFYIHRLVAALFGVDPLDEGAFAPLDVDGPGVGVQRDHGAQGIGIDDLIADAFVLQIPLLGEEMVGIGDPVE